MCHYCGCRQIPLLRDYIAEHERATNLADNGVRAIDSGDLPQAQRCIAEMAVVLEAHWRGEENGLFRIMARDEEVEAHIIPLVAEHRELAGLLASANVADPEDQARIRRAIVHLDEHISKEEDGLFPASLTALTGADWDASIAAWQEAHPGDSLIAD